MLMVQVILFLTWCSWQTNPSCDGWQGQKVSAPRSTVPILSTRESGTASIDKWARETGKERGQGTAAGCHGLRRSALLYLLNTAGFWTSGRERGRAGFGSWLTAIQGDNTQAREKVINTRYMSQRTMLTAFNKGSCKDSCQPPCCAASSLGDPRDWRQRGSKGSQAALPSREHLVQGPAYCLRVGGRESASAPRPWSISCVLDKAQAGSGILRPVSLQVLQK